MYKHTDLQTDMAHMQYIYVGLTQARPSKSHTISTNNVLDLLLFFSTSCPQLLRARENDLLDRLEQSEYILHKSQD